MIDAYRSLRINRAHVSQDNNDCKMDRVPVNEASLLTFSALHFGAKACILVQSYTGRFMASSPGITSFTFRLSSGRQSIDVQVLLRSKFTSFRCTPVLCCCPRLLQIVPWSLKRKYSDHPTQTLSYTIEVGTDPVDNPCLNQ